MYLSPPWQNIEPAGPVDPVGPAPPAPSAHLSPYSDPSSRKYTVLGVSVFSGVAGFVLLIIIFLNRKRLRTRLAKLLPWLGARLSAARGISFPGPMPASAYLCGLIMRSDPLPTGCVSPACPPPPYDALVGVPPNSELPPGSPPPGIDLPVRRATALSRSRAQPSPPPAYPPAPPPTPDLELPAAAAASATHLRGARSDTDLRGARFATRAPISPLPPLPVLVTSGTTSSSPGWSPPTLTPAHVSSAQTVPYSGPPPAYPPPPLPESHRSSASSFEVGGWNTWTAPWGLVQASSTPRASSILEARRDGA